MIARLPLAWSSSKAADPAAEKEDAAEATADPPAQPAPSAQALAKPNKRRKAFAHSVESDPFQPVDKATADLFRCGRPRCGTRCATASGPPLAPGDAGRA
jgi:hypothetical protein